MLFMRLRLNNHGFYGTINSINRDLQGIAGTNRKGYSFMKNHPIHILISLLLLVSLLCCTAPVSLAEPSEAVYALPIFETSDTHGRLADISTDSCQYRMAYISDKVKDVRGSGADYRKDLAVLLDGGDIYQGYPMSNLLGGQSLAAAYELMDYDAVTIGNHEFDWGIEKTVQTDKTMMDSTLEGASVVNDTPVVLCNLYLNGEKVPFTYDYVLLNKTARDAEGNELPVKIAVIGFAEDYSDSIMYSRFTGLGYSIDENFAIAEAIAAELESSGACDATVLLCHAEAKAMANGLSSDSVIDLVLGGHTHYNANGTTASGLRYMQPACNGQAYAYAELTFTAAEGGPVFDGVKHAWYYSTVSDTSKLLDLPENAEELDAEVITLTETVLDKLGDVLNTQVGYITTPALRYVYLPDSGERSTTAGNWMCSIFRRAVDADVGFFNAGGIRDDMEPAEGEDRRVITVSDLYTLFPFENKIYCYELTYEEFLLLMQYALTSNGSSLLSRMEGIDVYFTDQTVNAIVTRDGETVYANGNWKGDWKDRTLRVAVSNYIATNDGRPEGDFHNPLVAWGETERLISSDTVDVDGAIAVLTAEAEQNGGLLTVDDQPHLICKPFTEPEEPEDEPSCPWCERNHTGFFGLLVAVFHRILFFFAHLLGLR